MNFINNTNNDQRSNVEDVNKLSKSSTKILRPWLTEEDSKYYKMDHSKRGVAVIFNQETFINKNVQLRSGTTDCSNLDCTLTYLGFEVLLYCDSTFTDVKTTLRAVADMDHSEHDCLIIVVLTYGNCHYLYAHDTYYTIEFLCNHFTIDKCPSLAGKPKLFFIQTSYCDVVNPGTSFGQRETDYFSNTTLRIEPDFLIVYSTIPGHNFGNCILQSSWFIEALCVQLYENAIHYHLMTLLTFVCNNVTADYPTLSKNLIEQQKKQIPCIISMLTRLVKFTLKRYMLD